MRPGSWIEQARTSLANRMDREVESVDAVYDDDLWAILEEFGLLDQLDRGELTCMETGVVLTRQNVGALVVTPDGLRILAEH